jgi:PadR family transcriptional regulator PadR
MMCCDTLCVVLEEGLPVDVFSSWLAQARKGIVELFVLELLSRRGRLHGYGIVGALDELGDLVAGVSTVYPVLKRLESDGLVDATWVTDAPGNPRKYYEITPAGTAFLIRAQAEWDLIGEAMHSLRGERS